MATRDAIVTAIDPGVSMDLADRSVTGTIPWARIDTDHADNIQVGDMVLLERISSEWWIIGFNYLANMTYEDAIIEALALAAVNDADYKVWRHPNYNRFIILPFADTPASIPNPVEVCRVTFTSHPVAGTTRADLTFMNNGSAP